MRSAAFDPVAALSCIMCEILPTHGPDEAGFAALEVQERVWRFLNWQSRLDV